MKNQLLIILSILACTGSFAQQKNYQKEVQINKTEFNEHLPFINFITKPSKKTKSKGVIKIKTVKKTIVLKDDGEMVKYIYKGDLKDTPLILIDKLEPNTEEYYFINTQIGSIDTLLNKPIFYSNKHDIVCLEGSGTDVKQRIQVGRIQNNRFITLAYFKLSDNVTPGRVYWFNKNTIFIEDNGTKFYKLIFKINKQL